VTDGVDVAEELRRFSRSYTQRIGILDGSYLGTGRSLGVARVLFEIGDVGGTVRDLRQRLDLDSGYLSRVLQALESDGLVTLAADPADRRRRIPSLTAAGRREWRRLDSRSQQRAEHLVSGLDAARRRRLAEALQTADRLLRVAAVRFEEVPASHPAAIGAMSAYFAELDERFVNGFDPGDTLVADAPAMTTPNGCFMVARCDDDVVACGGVMAIGQRVGEVKRMWVAPRWRGVGLGARLLAELESRAAALGHHTVRLDTNDVLLEAIALYERAGYRHIERYNDNQYARHWFEKSLGSARRARRASDRRRTDRTGR
jgi:DNA-binding MarR family transcriptional regulator/GNAT superfamily N-acetyltransferase